MALVDSVYQYLQAIPDKRTSVAVVKAFERIWPRVRAVNITASLTLNPDLHDGKILTVNAAAGVALVLPASTGQGSRYRMYLGTAVTSNSTTIKVANATDFMFGGSYAISDDAGTPVKGYATANTGTAATESDTITLNGTTTGGLKGDYIDIEDVALNQWRVLLHTRATGTEATPFSASV